MTKRVAICSLVLSELPLLSGCNDYALDTEWRDGNYRLIAIDTRGQMSLSDTSDKTWKGIGPTVFAIGADKKFIVVARHPSTNHFGEFDRAITQYFVVGRDAPGHPTTGPLTKEQFQGFSSSNALPQFTKTFDDLK